ncbi:MAG TPA: lipocalin-like domain-containing protein [Chthoniobacterales bacterium]|jgi:predicted secreted hydrolase|nr:lipocalin-like domain-containing protein [Chthoniobacterales bacterium]
MRRRLVVCALALACTAADWKIAEPGWPYEFPRDHYLHEKFKTEWWYFTGNLTNESGRRFGYELTFFRQGIRPPDERAATTSRFVVDDLKFAHFTVTDAAGKAFLFQQKASRGSFGNAGFANNDRIAWIESWSLKLNADGSFDLAADTGDAEVQLHLIPSKPPIVHGAGGLSRKAAGAGHASHYYSITRLKTSGSLRARKDRFVVTGESWFDHEWATNQLAPGQAGWNWVSAQFDDDSELMLYQMRLTSGAIDPISSGTFVRSDGSSTALTSADFQMTPETFWKSKATQANYPIRWRITVPQEKLEFTIQPVLSNQELVLDPLVYWEGAFDLAGRRAGNPVRGCGYLELTGYAGRLRELSR